MAQAGSKDAAGQSTPPRPAQAPEPPTAPPATTAADARVAELEAENKRLREQLAAAGKTPAPAKPTEPKFVLSEGQRDELERNGRTVSPFTGARLVGTGRPGEKPRVASAEEFAKAKPPAKG